MAATDRLPDASVLPLLTIDPTAALGDLEPLARRIPEHVRVLAIGESAHGAHEFYALRHRLIRFFVERLGFSAVVWESGFPEGFLVNDYIHGRGPDRQRALLEGMTMHMGRCQEMADLLDGLRAHNASRSGPAGSVDFYGLDLPGSSATLKSALEVVGAYLEAVDPGAQVRLMRLRQLAASFGPAPGAPSSTPSKLTLDGTATVYQYMAVPAADRHELTALLADLAARFAALRRTYVEHSDAARYDLARQHLRVAAQLDLQLRAVAALMGGDAAACQANIRDLTMADTVEWILDRHQRILMLAHNGHIQKTPIATYAGPIDTVGVHLAHRLGEAYFTIGTTCGRGDVIATRTSGTGGSQETELVIRDLPPAEPDAIDCLLDASLPGMGLLDLRTLDPQAASRIDAARRMRLQDQVTEINVRQAFDMLIHMPRITLWTSSVSLPDLRAAKAP